MNMVSITYYGMSGEGRTITEAKREAGSKIESMLSDFGIRALQWKGKTALIWRDLYGWSYRILDAEGESGHLDRVFGNGTRGDLAECEREVRHHLAQITWTHEDDDKPSIITDQRDKHQFARWCLFQHNYKTLRLRGLGDTDAHRMACESGELLAS